MLKCPESQTLKTVSVVSRLWRATVLPLLFKNVVGKRFPVVTNLFGTAGRVQLAFGDRPRELVQRVAALPHELLPPTFGKLWQARDLAGSALRIGRLRDRV